MPLVRSEPPMVTRLGGALVVTLALPNLAEARTPLPTIEVVQPKRPVRLLDLRWNVQVGGALALGERLPTLALAQGLHISFVELSKTMQLHLALGEAGLVDLSPGWRSRRGLLGLDAGLGISRHRPGGPALALTVSAGPRWANGPDPQRAIHRGPSWRIDAWGVVGQLDAYPFYLSMPALIESDARWFRRFVLSGLGLWTAVRYDVYRDRVRTPAIAAGASFDVGRTVLAPLVLAATRRR